MGFVRINIQEAVVTEITLYNGQQLGKTHFSGTSCTGSCSGTTIYHIYGDSQDLNNATVLYSDNTGNTLATTGYYCFEVLNSSDVIYYWDGNTLTLQNC